MEPLSAEYLRRYLLRIGYGINVVQLQCGLRIAVLDMQNHSVLPGEKLLAEFQRLRVPIAAIQDAHNQEHGGANHEDMMVWSAWFKSSILEERTRREQAAAFLYHLKEKGFIFRRLGDRLQWHRPYDGPLPAYIRAAFHLYRAELLAMVDEGVLL